MTYYTGLSTFWFGLIGLLWAGYFVLEGFDFGVAIVSPLISRDETDRRICLNAIGPVWDGNEVWLLTAGGATFAAFPLWYGSLFSGAYLALFLVLIALIVRNVSFEFRAKIDDARWRLTWDIANCAGSLVPALVWGVAFTNFAQGLPLTANGYTGGLIGLLNPLALVGGLAAVCVFTFHGSIFLSLKTKGELRARASRTGSIAGVAGVLLLIATIAWIDFAGRPWANVPGALAAEIPFACATAAVVLIAVAYAMVRLNRAGPAFVMTSVAIVLLVTAVWTYMFPMAIPASSGAVVAGVPGVPIGLAASQPYTLTVMTIVALIFTPFVLLYQGWTYWIFRRRLERPAGTAPKDTQAVSARTDGAGIPVTR